jgi:DNA-binding LacI/PurR family transcriptional regulator
MKPRVTQRDVARKAGVSHVTVSLALRGSPSISQQTRNRIAKIAKHLGYSPDPMLTALSSYRKQNRPAAYHANIAWLRTGVESGSSGSGEFGLYFQGAQTRAKQLGYMLDEIDLNERKNDLKWLQRLLEARNITGLILTPAASAGSIFKFDLSRYSVVRIGYSYRGPTLNTVANAQFRTTLTVMEKVVALGYKRVGALLTKDIDERTSWHFLGGYLAGQHLLPKKDRITPFYATPRVDLVPAVLDWIIKQKIDCLVATGYRDLYYELVQRGLKFPGTIGYADTQAEEDDTFFSGIHQNSRRIGMAAVELLASMIYRDETGAPEIPSHLLVEGSWRDGKTLSKRG